MAKQRIVEVLPRIRQGDQVLRIRMKPYGRERAMRVVRRIFSRLR